MNRLARLRQRLRPDLAAPRTPEERWLAYLSEVEPALAALPRVHLAAQPPVLGAPHTRVAPVAVWIEGEDEVLRAATRASLAASTAPPAVLLAGSLVQALGCAHCDWIALVRAGDQLSPLALERLGQAATLAPDAAVITCDDDLLDAAGQRRDPRFRPGPSPDRWLACDDSGSLLLVNRERALAAARGLAEGSAWRHELALVLAQPTSGAGHAHVPMLLCRRGPGVAPPPPLGPETVRRLLAERSPGAGVEQARNGERRVRWPATGEPSVEVVVCFRDRPQLLERCVRSLLAVTDYERLRVALVDNGSGHNATAELLAELVADERVRALRDDRPFNYARLNNAAAAGSSADVLVFLNNDTEVIEPGWIATLLEEATRPEVGAVAPLLLFADGTVQHAGAAIGLHGYAGHPFAGLAPDAATPFGRADQGTRNWLAVTAACMMVERAKFAGVGGFDESFVVAGNDVELCLRLTRAGHRSLCVPHATLVHDESSSRGSHIDPGDFVRSEQTYGEFRTVGDPFYNPNLTLTRTDCGVRVPGE